MNMPNPLSWICLVPIEGATEEVDSHVIPDNDIRQHEAKEDCWCSPNINPGWDETQWMHNALDGREDYEFKRRKPH